MPHRHGRRSSGAGTALPEEPSDGEGCEGRASSLRHAAFPRLSSSDDLHAIGHRSSMPRASRTVGARVVRGVWRRSGAASFRSSAARA